MLPERWLVFAVPVGDVRHVINSKVMQPYPLSQVYYFVRFRLVLYVQITAFIRVLGVHTFLILVLLTTAPNHAHRSITYTQGKFCVVHLMSLYVVNDSDTTSPGWPF